jgi:LSD1 subclass zinc finger protein
MLIECERCGAPLDVPDGSQIVRCQYCGQQTRVLAPQRPHPPQPPYPPPGGPWGAPPGGMPPAYPQRIPQVVVPRPRAPGCATPLIAVVIGVLAVGAIGFLQVINRLTGGSGSRGSLLGPSAWAPHPRACFVDANGDGVLDIAGMSGTPGNTRTPTLVDGQSGKVTWQGPHAEQESKLYCVSPDWIVVTHAGFHLDFYSVRNPAAPVKVLARDELQAYAAGRGCVSIKTSDGSVQGIQLPGGAATRCDAGDLVAVHENPPGLIGLTGESSAVTLGQKAYILRKRSMGSPVLSVEARDGSRTSWQKELPYQASTFASGIAASPDRVMVWGAEATAKDQGVLIGLDANSGSQLYARPQTSLQSGHIHFIGFNGRYLVTSYWTGLYAYEPATGDRVWKIGG